MKISITKSFYYSQMANYVLPNGFKKYIVIFTIAIIFFGITTGILAYNYIHYPSNLGIFLMAATGCVEIILIIGFIVYCTKLKTIEYNIV